MNPSNLTGGALTGAQVASGDRWYVWDVSASGVARQKYITTTEVRRALAEGYNAQTWASGTLTITPGDFVQRHLEVLTVSLSAGAATLTVADGSSLTRFAGNRLELLFLLPATAAIVITILNSNGDTLGLVESDGTGDDALVELYHNGTTWQPLRKTSPLGL
jgi:hypothetical protein